MALQTKSISANGSRGHHKFTLNVVENSTSVDNNTSSVSWSLVLSPIGSGWDWYYSNQVPVTYSVTVNGQTKTGNIMNYNGSSTITVASGSQTIAHNADGNKTISFSFSISSLNYSYLPGSASNSGSMALTFIARASQPSCVTWPEHTQNVGEFGDTISIHMNRKSSNFTHTVRYQFGQQSGTIATGVGTGTTWVIPLTLMNLIPNAVKGSGTIYVDTYNGSTKIGTKSCGFTATVPASVKPTCTLAVSDPTGHLTTYDAYVKGLSKLKVTITPVLAYGSTIKTYNTTANGTKYTTASFTTDILNYSGTLTVSTVVTDNRGRSASASKTISAITYTAPAITKLTVRRCNADGSTNEQGAYVQVTFSATVTALNNKNSATYKLRYKKSSATSFTEITISDIADAYTVTDHQYILAADTGSSYDVEVQVVDNHSTATRSTSASTAFTLMHFGADGTSIGIGKVAEEENTLDIALDMHTHGTMEMTGNRYTAASIGTGGTSGFIKMVTIQITKDYADTPLTFVFNRRQAISPMTVHVKFKSTVELNPDIDTITYEGSNYGAFLVQSTTSVWDLYVQKVSTWDSITLLDWYVSALRLDRFKVTFPGTQVSTVPTPFYRATPLVSQSILDCIMPVGFVLTLYSHANPNTMYPGTTWVRITNSFLWACDANGDIGVTGGEKTVTLTVNQIPSHNHGVPVASTATGTSAASNMIRYNNNDTSYVGSIASNNTGGGQAHNNMPPYIHVSMWRRTA